MSSAPEFPAILVLIPRKTSRPTGVHRLLKQRQGRLRSARISRTGPSLSSWPHSIEPVDIASGDADAGERALLAVGPRSTAMEHCPLIPDQHVAQSPLVR